MVLNAAGTVNISNILLVPKGMLTKALGSLAPYLGKTIPAKGRKTGGTCFCDLKI